MNLNDLFELELEKRSSMPLFKGIGKQVAESAITSPMFSIPFHGLEYLNPEQSKKPAGEQIKDLGKSVAVGAAGFGGWTLGSEVLERLLNKWQKKGIPGTKTKYFPGLIKSKLPNLRSMPKIIRALTKVLPRKAGRLAAFAIPTFAAGSLMGDYFTKPVNEFFKKKNINNENNQYNMSKLSELYDEEIKKGFKNRFKKKNEAVKVNFEPATHKEHRGATPYHIYDIGSDKRPVEEQFDLYNKILEYLPNVSEGNDPLVKGTYIDSNINTYIPKGS